MKKPMDEMCTCGHFRSDHSGADVPGLRGHGYCKVCECSKFTWKSFVWA